MTNAVLGRASAVMRQVWRAGASAPTDNTRTGSSDRRTATAEVPSGQRTRFRLLGLYVRAMLAAAAALKGDDAWAARILGARDDVAERTGATPVDLSVRIMTDQAGRDVRARLGPERWARAYPRQGVAPRSTFS